MNFSLSKTFIYFILFRYLIDDFKYGCYWFLKSVEELLAAKLAAQKKEADKESKKVIVSIFT
jgi:hypothetical protein